MLDLSLQTDSIDLLDAIEDFAAKRLRPRAADADATCAPASGVQSLLTSMGIAPAIPEQFGGGGIPDPTTRVLIAERLGYGDAGSTLELLSSDAAAALVGAAGSPGQRQSLLSRFVDPAGVAANVLYYEGFGRGPSDLGTRATRSGQDWTLRGRKTSVVRPKEAELSVVLARTDDGTLAAFILGGEQIASLRVVRDDAATGKLGLRAARTANVAIDDIVVPGDQHLVNGDPLALHRAVSLFRLQPAAVALGVGAAALHYAVDYTRHREAWGQPVFRNQGVSFPLTDTAIALDVARLDLLALVGQLEDLQDAVLIEKRTTAVVHLVHRTVVAATRLGINSLGGHGYLADHPVERWFRDASTLASYDFDPLASDNETI